jgi:hypothetical protein
VVATRGRLIGARVNQRVTVEQYADRWLGEFIDAAENVDRYRRDVATYILPALGTRLLVEVTAADVENLIGEVAVAVSPSAEEQLRATLHEMFAGAVEDDVVTCVPGNASTPPASVVCPCGGHAGSHLVHAPAWRRS